MKIQAIIIKYLLGDLHFDYEDCSERFDGIKLKIITPKNFEGKEIYIFHDESPTEDNPWNSIGKTVEFDYGDNVLDFDKHHVFTTSLKNILFKK